MASQAGLSPEFQRLHGMGEALYARRRTSATATSRCGSTPRSAATRTCCPIWSAACWRTAPTPRSSTPCWTRRRPSAKVVVDPIGAVEAAGAGAAPAHPPAARPLRARAEATPAASTSPSPACATALARRSPQLAAARRPGRSSAASWRRTAPARPRVSPSDLGATIGRAVDADGADSRRGLRRRAGPPSRPGTPCGGEGRAEVLRAMADALEADRERLIAICVREAGKTLADGVAEVREAADFCRYYASLAERQFAEPETLRGPGGRDQPAQPARPRRLRLHQPLELPAGHLHRPDRRGPGRRQRGAGQARRADPADRRRGRAAVPRRRPRRRTCCTCCPATARRVGAALVGHPGCDGVAFTGGTETAWAINRTLAARQGPIVPVHRRDRRAERHVRGHHGAARTGDRRRAGLGLRLGRPALLGAAHPVRAARHRRRC